MTAILRVKRKKDEEPSDALLISCKRQKLEHNELGETPLTAIVKFAGTVEKQEDCVVKQITKILTKNDLKENFKQHFVDITKKNREKIKEVASASRYKIISNIRSLNTSLSNDLEGAINIIDVEDTKHISADKNNGFVYDLYFTQTKNALEIENLLSVLPIHEDLVFEDCYDNENENNGESEDSNSESNWRNDYPDSDHSDESVREKDIRNAIKNLNVDELSSDSDEFVYGLDKNDVERYGYKYAKYKLRIKKEKEKYSNLVNKKSDLSDNDTADEFDEYYINEDE